MPSSTKKVIVSVTNDLSTDQRVHKVCTSLLRLGFDVILVGRKRRLSRPLETRNYKCVRMPMLFERGPLFYAEFQCHLLLFLIFNKVQVLVSNDLDTLLPNYIASKIKGAHLVYDSHEYFTEVPELQHSPFKKSIWKSIERFIFPKLKYVFTVNESIKDLYEKEYGVKVNVLRNLPSFKQNETVVTRQEYNLPLGKKIIILQGAGINVDRGGEEAVEAMQYVQDALLLIVGSGDVIPALKETVIKLKLSDRVLFIDKQPFDKLRAITRLADIGLTLDKDSNVNYRFSLPNKLFDYIQAGVPILSSRLIEIEKIFSKYPVGVFIESHDPKEIAAKINYMLTEQSLYKKWQDATVLAAHELSWENEERIIKEVYKQFL